MKLAQVGVNAKDLRRATAFYRDVLKLPFLFEAPGLAFFNAGGVRIMLSKPERAEFDRPGSILYYQVPEIGRAYEEIKSRGARFEAPPKVVHRAADHELWMAVLRDTEGNTLAIIEPRPV